MMFFRFGQLHDPLQERVAEQEHEDRSDIDGQEFEAALRCKSHRPEEGPGRAVDRQAESVDVRPRAAGAVLFHAPITDARDGEQQRHIGNRDNDDDPALHGPIPSSTSGRLRRSRPRRQAQARKTVHLFFRPRDNRLSRSPNLLFKRLEAGPGVEPAEAKEWAP